MLHLDIALNTSVNTPTPEPGLAARLAASQAFERTLSSRQNLDDVLDKVISSARGLEQRDNGLVRAITTATFRHLGTITRAIDTRVERGAASLPRTVQAIMATAVAQILFLEAADHAAVDLAVAQTKLQPQGMRFAGVVNAVLRKIVREADEIKAQSDPLAHDTPVWLGQSWIRHYGQETAAAIAACMREELALDLTVKAEPERWAHLLDAMLLPTGSLRLSARTPVHELPGFENGDWWVQDAASAVPVRLLGVKVGDTVLDMCAAPGGKTAQLANAGGVVTAIDRSGARLRTLEANMKRLGFAVDIVVGDAATYDHAPFDVVLLDAPCTATGTMRRHPDAAWIKDPADLEKLVSLQAKLLDRAVDLVRVGGRVMYCTCSLEPEEGEAQVTALLARRQDIRLDPISDAEVGVAGSTTERGEFRATPVQMKSETPRLSGWGGFFAARFVRL